MLMQGGNEIVWTPTTGEYVIDVTVNSPTDDDPGNNAYQTYVKVVDWVDIKVDLAWTPAGQEPSDSIVSCDNNQCPFTLSVTLDVAGKVPKSVMYKFSSKLQAMQQPHSLTTVHGLRVLTKQMNSQEMEKRLPLIQTELPMLFES